MISSGYSPHAVRENNEGFRKDIITQNNDIQ